MATSIKRDRGQLAVPRVILFFIYTSKRQQVISSPKVAGFQRFDCNLQKNSQVSHYVTAV